MEHFQFTDDAHMLCEMLTKHWTCSPPFGDAVPFLQNCPVPVFVVSSNDTLYLEEGLRRLDVPIAGLVSSEMSGAYKPDTRIFKKALEVSGCLPEEVIHIGDSLRSDALGAQKAGIKPLLLDRYGKYGPCVLKGKLTDRSAGMAPAEGMQQMKKEMRDYSSAFPLKRISSLHGS